MKILNFGSCNIDYVYRVSHFVKPGETMSSINREIFPGGKGLNQSIAVAKSGSSVYHAGCIGEDGTFLKEMLEESGVDTSFLKIIKETTGHAVIQVNDAGENCIILYGGANYEIDKVYIDKVLSNFTVGDIIILQNEISNLPYIINKAYERGMQIVFNPSPFDKSLQMLDLNKVAYMIINEVEAYELSGLKTPDEICEYFRKNYNGIKVVLTLGSKGCAYFDDDVFEYCPAFNVDAKDTTSAGDAFMGYFISGILKNMSVKETLRYASAASAITVSRCGASVSVPLQEEVETMIENMNKETIN